MKQSKHSQHKFSKEKVSKSMKLYFLFKVILNIANSYVIYFSIFMEVQLSIMEFYTHKILS